MNISAQSVASTSTSQPEKIEAPVKILIAGIGNIFLGDDAFGVEVARSLHKRRLASSVVVRDFGIRGVDLAYALLEAWDAVILIDAMARGEPPGTLFVMEPNLDGSNAPVAALNGHDLDPVRVLQLAASLGPILAQVILVGCEPQDVGDELDGRMGLSPSVQSAVEDAADLVETLIAGLLQQKPAKDVGHTEVQS